jgi:hypothetical protein
MNSNENNSASQTEPAEEKVREVHHHHYHHRPGFNFGKLLLGLIVVGFGLVFLARNMGWLPYDLRIDWSFFWPIAVILIGLSLMSGRGWFSLLIGIVVTLLVLSVIGGMFWSRMGFARPEMMRGWRGDWRQDLPRAESQPFSIAKDADAKRADIAIRGGAGLITVQGGTDRLAEGSLISNFSTVSTSSRLAGDRQEAAIEASGKGGIMMSRGWKNDLSVTVTQQIPVDLTVDGGAASLQLDLTRVIAESVKINTGASKVDLSLGDKAALAKVDINAGASSVDIEAPKSLGLKVTLQSALTSIDLPGLEKTGDNTYMTKDYDAAGKKAELNLELGVSSLKLNLK